MKENWRDRISQHEFEIKTERDVFVPIRDKTRLCVNIFRPNARGRFLAGFLKILSGILKMLASIL